MESQNPGQATLRNLADAGCDEDTVRCYCELERRPGQEPLNRKEQIRLLGKHRKALLTQLHA